jgi:hypothetical protein
MLGQAAAILLGGCGKHTASQSFAGLVQVSAGSPFPSGCGGPAGPNGVGYLDAEVEPQLAINPANPQNLIAVWQQDRWSNGGSRGIVSAASFDAGHSWTRVAVPFTQCAGGAFERGSDPWVTFAPDGSAYQIALTFDESMANRGVLVARSVDGGRTWSAPITLQHDLDPDLAVDKETITADPQNASLAYAVWDRVTGFTNPSSPSNRGPAWFARTTDAGFTWSAPVAIFDPGADAQTVSNQIAVLPDGALLDGLMVITKNSSQNPLSHVTILRSADKGLNWSAPIDVAAAEFIGVVDPKTNKGVRSGTVVPSLAVDPASGAVYVVWEDARFSGGARDGIALSKSSDGGLHWSQPVQVNQAPAAQAFTPVVSVSAGEVGVSYTDLRNDDPNDKSRLLATHWLAVSADGGNTWQETQLVSPFDLQNAPFAGGYFLGDYEGLVHSGASFLPLFTVARDGDQANRTDIFFRPADAPPLARSPVVALESMFRGARERWRFGTLFK